MTVGYRDEDRVLRKISNDESIHTFDQVGLDDTPERSICFFLIAPISAIGALAWVIFTKRAERWDE
uniref:AlNc14C264G9872 protein n=1 Tax=Albugo laibachii Nc14 TaxID=890382 RepID=F0WU49_9STRA|nr:AlNc14C264G9872 [Albugo laibachii Nc14]|eukprot:CCA24894.1 AlNc14C264G9872 [Albugo laibachii Nc14]